ncbi:Transposase and inactivated derivatives [Ferriphaselus amnicola]|uniref:Transposase and inactivated derivatives n=1 Tax=Ferriphaselus amnicola TaxID=1188319 RepID=A0A2Z6GAU2_9PROT|nr:Transposase and inactivated derivatives [Ferriphaselus amnicola]
MIKSGFSRRLEKVDRINPSRRRKGERGIWQRCYWEHQIRDEHDLTRHIDYIHYNLADWGMNWVAAEPLHCGAPV